MSLRAVAVMLTCAAMTIASCGGNDDQQNPAVEALGNLGAATALEDAVAATLDAQTATFVLRHGHQTKTDFSVDGVYDLASGNSAVVVRSVYSLDDGDRTHRMFERIVVDERVFLREGDFVTGIRSELDIDWTDVTGSPDRDHAAARGPEVVRLLESLQPIKGSQASRTTIAAAAPADRVLAVMVPDLLTTNSVGEHRSIEVDVEVRVARGRVVSVQFDGRAIGRALGSRRIAAMVIDDVTYDPTSLGTLTLRLSGIGQTVEIIDPMAVDS